MTITVNPTPEKLAKTVAAELAAIINSHKNPLLCFAAGDTPLKMLAELIELQRIGQVDLSAACYVGLDEWAGLGAETTGSCAQVMYDNFYTPAGIPAGQLCTFNGKCADYAAECDRIEQFITAHGGIDVTLLGVGMNGHVGFNEPGSPADAFTHIATLDETTLRVGPKYFGGAACPGTGLTVGLGALLNARQAMLMATGAHKADIMRRALMQPPTTDVPASLFQTHPCLRVYLDDALFCNL